MGDGNIWNLDPIATEKKKNLEKKKNGYERIGNKNCPTD